jgi:aspartate/methionine/tyrosine aminotransferase
MINQEAKELNDRIQPKIYSFLSEKGKEIYFPKQGILEQTKEAKGKEINATIGIAIEDNKEVMCLESIKKNILLKPNKIFPYAPSYGIKELREIWETQIKQKNPSLNAEQTKISLPIVTSGITHGLSIISYLFINPNEEVILTNLFWENYNLIIENGYNARLKPVNTFKENGFDLENLQKELQGEGKKIVLLNFPNNPTGYSLTNTEAEELIQVIKEAAEQKQILIICDDAYFGLFYEENVYQEPLFSKLANLHENVLAIKIDGATKEDYVWGLRLGFLTYGAKNIDSETLTALEEKTAGTIRGSLSSCCHLSQSLLLEAFRSSTYKEEKENKYLILKSRYQKVKETLKNEKYKQFFTPLPFNSGYFMCVKLNENLNGERVRKVLLENYNTGVVALGNLLRIAFSSVSEENIELLFDNIYNACKSLFVQKGIDKYTAPMEAHKFMK